MCREFVTYWYGEMASQWAARRHLWPSWKVLEDVAIRCGNQEVVLKKCFKARFFGKCANTTRSVTKVKTLCPQCFATSHNDPFYLIHLQPKHHTYSPPASPRSSAHPTTATATAIATVPIQSPEYLLAPPTRPSATYQQRLPSGSYAQTQQQHPSRPTGTQRAQQQVGRSMTQPGLQRSTAVRRPPSRGQSSSSRTGPRHTRTSPYDSDYYYQLR